MLRRLSGRAHEVMTGVAVRSPSGVQSRVVISQVHFRKLSDAEIAWYVSTGEGDDKAGGYALQGRAGAFITSVVGSPSNVIGLPLAETVELLRAAGTRVTDGRPMIHLKSLETNFAAVESRIAAACKKANRPRESVTLVAVSKLHPPEAIKLAWQLGHRDFGENYAQELRDKHVGLADCAGLRWHAIGPVQPKNAKYVAKAATIYRTSGCCRTRAARRRRPRPNRRPAPRRAPRAGRAPGRSRRRPYGAAARPSGRAASGHGSAPRRPRARSGTRRSRRPWPAPPPPRW